MDHFKDVLDYYHQQMMLITLILLNTANPEHLIVRVFCLG